MLQVIALVVPLFSIILIGYFCGRLARISIEGLAWLNFFILYVALPALFFRLLSKTPIEEFTNSEFLLRTTAGTVAAYALCFLLACVVSREGIKVAVVQGLGGSYGNIGYLGPPLAIAAFGPQAGVPVALIFCIDNTLHFTLTPLLMSVGGRSGTTFNLVRGIVKKIMLHPFIVATVAGVSAAWFSFETPQMLDLLLVSLSGAAAPCALFAMGVTAALRPLKRVPVEMAYLVPVKLIVHPVIVYCLLAPLTGLDDNWLYSAVLLAALPSATNVFVLAQQYGVWTERASSLVVLSTLCSVVTITLFLYLARTGFL